MRKPTHDSVTDIKRGGGAEELINPSNVSEETDPNEHDNKDKFIPIDEVVDPDSLNLANETNKDEEGENLELEQVDTTLKFDLEKARDNLKKLKNEDSRAFAQTIINDQQQIIRLEKEIQELRNSYGPDGIRNMEFLSIKSELESEIFEILKTFSEYTRAFSKQIGSVDRDFIKRNIYNDFATKIENSRKKYNYEVGELQKLKEQKLKESQPRKDKAA